jgi:DNA-binding IclR family transcriptional regulator
MILPAVGPLGYRVRLPTDRRNMSRSATRALDVLEFFGEARRPLRAVEIARELEISPSSANQLLKTMVESAHLVFDASAKTYLPSPRLAAFGTWMSRINGGTGPLHDLVNAVRARTGMTVTVTTPNDLSMQIVDSAGSPGLAVQRGLQISLFGSATGSAYLASLADAEVRRLAHRARIHDRELPEILAMLGQIREAGLADGPSGGPGAWSLAMILPCHLVGVPSVLGLAGPADEVRANLAELSAIMHEAVARHFKR